MLDGRRRRGWGAVQAGAALAKDPLTLRQAFIGASTIEAMSGRKTIAMLGKTPHRFHL